MPKKVSPKLKVVPDPEIAERLPDTLIDRDRAICTASTAAGVLFETTAAQGMMHTDGMLDGAWWFTAGLRIHRAQSGPVLVALSDFISAHPDTPPEALWRTVADLVDGIDGDAWASQPGPVMIAYRIFRIIFLELDAMAQARVAALQLERPDPGPPPDRGIFRRTHTKKRPTRKRMRSRQLARAAGGATDGAVV